MSFLKGLVSGILSLGVVQQCYSQLETQWHDAVEQRGEGEEKGETRTTGSDERAPSKSKSIQVELMNPDGGPRKTFQQPQCREGVALGLPSDQAVRCYGGYLASLNYERRIPNWVIEVLDYETNLKRGGKAEEKDADEPAVSRHNSSFFADPTVDEPFRVAPSVYDKSGYWGISKGHLAPAQFHTNNQTELDATFNMNANIVPQDMALNALDWLRLEQLTRRLARVVQKGENPGDYEDKDARLYVATGPVFLPTRAKTPDGQLQMVHDVLEAKNQIVAVPTHLFKVFLSKRREKAGTKPKYTAAAFLMPNQAIPEERRMTDYQVPINTLESITGLRFFPDVQARNLPDLCRTFKCESKASPFTKRFRPIAQLRSAMSVPELRKRYDEIKHHTTESGGKLDPSLEKEYKKRLDVLVAAAIKPVDSV